ncbi:MAG: hypothetical protein ACE5EN_08045, partial [Nitrospinota bacterium]
MKVDNMGLRVNKWAFRAILTGCLCCPDKKIGGQGHHNELNLIIFPGHYCVVRYDNENKSSFIYFDDALSLVAFEINTSERKLLTSYIDKYQEWNIKASEAGDKFQKEIGEFTAKGYWKLGNDWYMDSDVVCSTLFFSQSEKIHQFIILFNEKWQSASNEFLARIIHEMSPPFQGGEL